MTNTVILIAVTGAELAGLTSCHAVLVRCALCVVFVGKECLLMCGVSDGRCLAFSFVRWLFGGSMFGLIVVLPLWLSFLAMPGLCCFLRVTPRHASMPTPMAEASSSDCNRHLVATRLATQTCLEQS